MTPDTVPIPAESAHYSRLLSCLWRISDPASEDPHPSGWEGLFEFSGSHQTPGSYGGGTWQRGPIWERWFIAPAAPARLILIF